MENATKALIIAGAILVAILLVTMGVALLSNTNGLTDSSNAKLSQLELEEFNGQIQNGVGGNVSGTNVITMLKNVQAKVRDKGDIGLTIVFGTTDTINTNSADDDFVANIDTMIDTIRNNRRYNVQSVKDPSSGYYTNLTITQN